MMYVTQARSSSCYASLCNVLLNVLSSCYFLFVAPAPLSPLLGGVFMAAKVPLPFFVDCKYVFWLWTTFISALVLLLKTLFILSTWMFSRFSNCLALTAIPPPQSPSIPSLPLFFPTFPALPLVSFG